MAKCSVCGESMPIGEEMFNYHGYSGPCPKPPLPQTKSITEFGWLLERGDPPEYIGIDHGFWKWSTDANKAIRFARREDAEAIATIIEDAWRIVEHSWG